MEKIEIKYHGAGSIRRACEDLVDAGFKLKRLFFNCYDSEIWSSEGFKIGEISETNSPIGDPFVITVSPNRSGGKKLEDFAQSYIPSKKQNKS